MSPNTPELQLRNWFGYLLSFKNCAAKIDTDVLALSCLDFANAKPTTYLGDAVTQNQFAVCVQNTTRIPVQASDVSAVASFEALLSAKFGAINAYVAMYLQSLTSDPFASMNIADFVLQKALAVYSKGATDPLWVNTDAGLAEIIDASCYSAKQRAAVALIVGDATKQVNDIVNQIAKPG